MEEIVRRIAGPERPSTLFSKAERPSVGQTDDFTLHMAEKLLQGTTHYAAWRNVRDTDPDTSRRMARQVVERHGLLNSRGSGGSGPLQGFERLVGSLRREEIPSSGSSRIRNKLSARGRSNPVEKASGPVPSAEPGSTRRAGSKDRYSNLDCYEFVAAVLEENGIRYYGKDGVGNALIEKARTERKSINHFLTGEGLTRLLSSDTISLNVKEGSVQKAWEMIEPRLKQGAILSFSTQRSGHTGIVGLRDGRWVFAVKMHSLVKLQYVKMYQII